VLHPQVFQYALVLQFRNRIPLMGATRRHAVQGALFALDCAPYSLGQQAAIAANQLLAGQEPRPAAAQARLSLNLSTARRIGAEVAVLRSRAAEALQ
jgi:ABC-type uncharacterized transport system substrate-binding protein